jgi:hypothetical protein
MKLLLPIFALCFSLYAALFSYASTKEGRVHTYYAVSPVQAERDVLLTNDAPEKVLRHSFKRKRIIGGVQGLLIGWLSIEGYRPAVDTYEIFTALLLKKLG